MMDYLGRPSVVLLLILSIASCAYIISLAVHRLCFHPLAKFPGPKLAALSRWYEFYYEVSCKGQFTFHIQTLHEKYGTYQLLIHEKAYNLNDRKGPVIRITPDELHVRDSEYWDTLYSRTARLDRYEWMSGRMAMNGAIFTTSKHDLHRLRKSALNPLFSKRSIVKFQPIIRDKVDVLCGKFAQYKENDQILPIGEAFSAFAGDIITQYSFGWCYDHLESPNFSKSFHEAFLAVSAFSATSLQFPWIMPLINSLPENIAVKFNPPLHMLLVLRRDLKRQIGKIVNGEKESEHTTIFREVLDSDLPQHEKTLDRLEDEAFGIMGAGTETTAWALTTAAYYIISQPAKMNRLQDELRAALPDTAAPLDWLLLEKLPYLSACLTEAIRMSYGVVSRLPRICPNKSMKYKGWEIPANTPVSMTIVDGKAH